MLTQVKVTGFKAIKDSGPVSLGKLTLFIGRNGTGKSSFIEALQWLQEAVNEGLLAATEERFNSFDELCNRRIESGSIGLNLTLDSGPKSVRYELWVKSGSQQHPIVDAEKCSEGRTSGSVVSITTRRGKTGPAVRSIRGGNPVREGDTLALSQVEEKVAPGAKRLLRYIREAVFLRLSPTQMAHAGRLRRKARGPLLDEEGRNLATLLAEMEQEAGIHVMKQVAQVIHDVEAIEVNYESKLAYFATHERMKVAGGQKTFTIPAWLLSEGTRRITAIFALLALSPRPSLIAIEEIENGLDPWTLQLIFRALRQAADEGVQIILTTHSPFLLDHVEPEEVIHVTREVGETRYTPITRYDQVTNYKGMVAPGAMYISEYFSHKGKGG